MKNTTVIFSLLLILCGCTLLNRQSNKEKVVLISTSYGDIKVKLYNETPLHRDNFIKLVEEGFYDSLLFHRVISNFMIQGGDPDSKGAKKGKALGEGDVGYMIPSEFNTNLFHKKGALAAARQPDNVNPERKSSGCQFYIVQGAVQSLEQLKNHEERLIASNKSRYGYMFLNLEQNKALKDSLTVAQQNGDMERLNVLVDSINKAIEPRLDSLRFSDEELQAYTTIGGTPHLDHQYTVFGEVIEGLNIVDSIAQVITDKRNRPQEDVIFSAKVLK